MKKLMVLLLLACLVSGCGSNEKGYPSRFAGETVVVLSDSGITVDGGGETKAVFTSRDIIYHEDRLAYDSGNPYGEGQDWQRHTKQEADAHLVVNITAPGAYRLQGKLSLGQIRIDLGEKARKDKNAVVELVLDGAHITCQVAPAILFQNVYECARKEEGPEADTFYAGANLILLGENQVSGSHVARIFKDKEGAKKLWKQDGAIYSYVSMNVDGPGSLRLQADNEGFGTERHLTVNGGQLAILSHNDGINANEDGVSVITINGGDLRIAAGLGEEGDGIDSNGYLVVNGGTVTAWAKPLSDGGLDSSLGTYLNGGTVLALGSGRNWASQDSRQTTLNLEFSREQTGSLRLLDEQGTALFAFDPASDPVLKDYSREFRGAVLSTPELEAGRSYTLTVDGQPLEPALSPDGQVSFFTMQ